MILTVATYVRMVIESDIAANKTAHVKISPMMSGGWVCEVSDGVRTDTINSLDEWGACKSRWVAAGPGSADTLYGCFHVYLLFCLWGSAICIVLGGIVLAVKFTVLGGIGVIVLGVVALCLLPFFFLWVKKQGRAIEIVIGGVILFLIIYVMLNIQSHISPR